MEMNKNTSGNQDISQELPIKYVSNFRNVLAQCIALGAVSLLNFGMGNLIGMTTVLLPIVYGNNAEEEVKMSKSEYTWFTSYFFMESVGAIIVGPVAHVLGSRVTLMIASIGTSGCWITFYFAKSATVMMIAQAVSGLTKAFILAPGFAYLAEVSQPNLRGTLMAISSFCIIIGTFFTVLINKFIPWRTVALINFALSVSGFAALLCVPNSPYWLTVQDRFAEAERSLAWLRGWTTPENVRAEFQHITRAHRENQRTLCNDKRSWKSKVAPYFKRSFLIPLILICFLFTMDATAGGQTLQVYSIKIFEKIKAPLDKHVASIIFEGMRVAGAIFCILTLHRIGKKNMCLISLGFASLCYLVVAIVIFMLNENLVSGQVYLWISPIMIIISTFVVTAGIAKIPSILNGELFPVKYRNIGSAIGTFWLFTAMAASKKIFEYMIDLMTLSGVFLVFAIIGLFGFVTIYLTLPETNGRSLMEIENHFSGVKKLNDKSRDQQIVKNIVRK